MRTFTLWAWGLGVILFALSCELGEVITLGHSVGVGGSLGSGSGGIGSGGVGSGGAAASFGGMGFGGLPPVLTATGMRPISELASDEKDDNPTLTADELMLCFTSLRPGGTGDNDVWCAERTSADQPFDAPLPIEVVNEEGFEASPALDLDGLSLWFGSEREDSVGGSDIFVVTRSARSEAWGEPSHVAELSSEQDDIPRPPGMSGKVMPLGSRRGDDVSYWTYLAERTAPGAPFAPPVLIEELAVTDYNVVDGFLTDDGLLLLFTYDSRTDETDEDVYCAVRPNLASPFGPPIEVANLNGTASDRDPWLSVDRKRLYFASDRSGEFEIYVADLE
jgi:hypothetical protein